MCSVSIQQNESANDITYILFLFIKTDAAAGGADDWAYGSAKAKYAYTIELPDTGAYGFQLPASQIMPVGKSLTNALITLAKAVKQQGH